MSTETGAAAGPHGEGAFEKEAVDEERFLRVLDRLRSSLDATGVPFAFIGGIASAVLGRPRPTLDVDVLVRPWDVPDVMAHLESSGFTTQQTYPHWLFKARRDGVVTDVIFVSTGDLYLDDEMVARLVRREFMGRSLPVVAPEDLVVMKALAHSEETPRYWYDGLSILARNQPDWHYLLRRSRHGPRRVLSFLLFARSNGLVIPGAVVRALRGMIEGGRGAA